MGWDTVQGDWPRHVGQVRILWSKLTEAELQEVNGRRDVLVEMIHRKYQTPKDMVDEQVKIFESRFDDDFERKGKVPTYSGAKPNVNEADRLQR